MLNTRFQQSIDKWPNRVPPWMFPPLDIPFDFWIEHFNFGFLYVILLPGYSTEEFQVMQLIVFVVFGAVD